MKIKYWDKTNKKYITREEATKINLRGIRRHCYVTKEDLIKGDGLPQYGVETFNCDFLIVINKKGYKIIHPADNIPNVTTLNDDWIGEIVMVEHGKCQGLIDVNTGELLIPFDKQNYAIYPINKDYFCVVDPTLENKKIVNRKNQVIDSIHGTYVKSGDQLLRHSINKNGQYVQDGRVSINSLRRKEKTANDRKNLETAILNLKENGMSFPELSKLVAKIYDKDKYM